MIKCGFLVIAVVLVVTTFQEGNFKATSRKVEMKNKGGGGDCSIKHG